MYCLYCGDCCKRMSPISEGQCPHLTQHKNFVFCSKYESRPQQCQKHEYPSRFCPIGIDLLKLKNIDAIRERIDDGWEIIKRKR